MADDGRASDDSSSSAPRARRVLPPAVKELDRAMSKTVEAYTRWKKAPPAEADALRRQIDEAEARLRDAWAKFEAESKAWTATGEEPTQP